MGDSEKTKDQLIEELERLRKENVEITASLKGSNLGHHMEDALRESEAKYAAAFRTSPDSININTMDGVYVDINAGFTKMSGYTREDVIDVSSFEMKIWAKPVERAHLVKVLKRKGIIENMEATFRCKDGSVKIGLMSACIISIQNVPHILSITRDISDRKLIEKKLDESERKYRMIAEYTSDGILAFGADQKISYVSHSYLKQLGYSFEEEVGNDMTAIGAGIHPDDKDGLFASIKQAMEQKKTNIIYTYRIKNKTGLYIWREDNANFIYDADRNYAGTYITCRDITLRKQALDALKESEAKYSAAFRTSPDAVNITSMDGVYVDVNEGFCNMFGYAKQEAIGTSSNKLGIWVDPSHRMLFNAEIENKQFVENLETVFKCKNGELKVGLISACIVVLKEKPHVISITRDITERKRDEEQLRKTANELKHLNGYFIDRELKMIELKKEINGLLGKMGENPKYGIVG